MCTYVVCIRVLFSVHQKPVQSDVRYKRPAATVAGGPSGTE